MASLLYCAFFSCQLQKIPLISTSVSFFRPSTSLSPSSIWKRPFFVEIAHPLPWLPRHIFPLPGRNAQFPTANRLFFLPSPVLRKR